MICSITIAMIITEGLDVASRTGVADSTRLCKLLEHKQ